MTRNFPSTDEPVKRELISDCTGILVSGPLVNEEVLQHLRNRLLASLLNLMAQKR